MQNTQSTKERVRSTQNGGKHPYLNFCMVLIASIAVMFFTSYLNTYDPSHIFFSQTRLYMSILMGMAMSLVMLSFMRKTSLRDGKANLIATIVALVIGASAFFLVRDQLTVQDVAYMEAMIPHHSTAILTSNRARIRDPRVRMLADKISKSQKEEIAQMRLLLNDIKKNGIALDRSR